MIHIQTSAPKGVKVRERMVDPSIGQIVYAVMRIDEEMRMEGLRMKHVQESTHPCSRITHSLILTYDRS